MFKLCAIDVSYGGILAGLHHTWYPPCACCCSGWNRYSCKADEDLRLLQNFWTTLEKIWTLPGLHPVSKQQAHDRGHDCVDELNVLGFGFGFECCILRGNFLFLL